MQLFLEGNSLKTYLVGVIHPDPDAVSAWASTHHPHLKGKGYEQLCKTKELNDAIMADFKKLGRENEVDFSRLGGFGAR